eukprot:9508188-Heterocapsa_arctica.AAC.1
MIPSTNRRRRCNRWKRGCWPPPASSSPPHSLSSCWLRGPGCAGLVAGGPSATFLCLCGSPPWRVGAR